MELKKNDIVILKPFNQQPNKNYVNMEVYNRFKGKLLRIIEVYKDIYDKRTYYTFCKIDNVMEQFTGIPEIAIRFNNEEGL